MNPPSSAPDWQAIATVLGYLLMGIMSFFGAILWKDVQELRENRVTRADLDAAITKSNTERDNKHHENTGNFRRLDEKLDYIEQRHNDSALKIEQRIGQVLVEVAKLRPHRPDGPERRHY